MSQGDKLHEVATKGIEPQPEDVLCGKDKHCVHAPGSIRFRNIIDSYRERYADSLTKFDKMQITKEIYETLSQTSRFLKFNAKEKVWEEISPMAARDKCGHALRFANRLKTKKKAGPLVVQQKSSSKPSDAPAPAMITPTASSSPSAMTTAAAASATVSSHSQSTRVTDSNQLPRLHQSILPMHSEMEQQQEQQGTTTAAAQRLIFGELLKRYDTIWGSSHIQALAGLHASTSSATAANFLCAAAAAGTFVPAHAGTLQPLLPRPPVGATSTELCESATATVASPVVAPVAATVPIVLSGSAATSHSDEGVGDGFQNVGSGSSRGGDHARKPTLDDLCSLLLTAKQNN